MYENHPNHYTKTANTRRQEALDVLRGCQDSPHTADTYLLTRLACERRRVWERAIKTLAFYVPDTEPQIPGRRQREDFHEYQQRYARYEEDHRAYNTANEFVRILQERLALEEPPSP